MSLKKFPTATNLPLQTFTNGINTYSILGANAAIPVALFNTTTALVSLGGTTFSSIVRISNLQISTNALDNTNTTGGEIYIGSKQSSGSLYLGGWTGSPTRTGAVWIGKDNCSVNVGGNMTLLANKFITTTTTGTNSVPTANQIGNLLATNTFNTTVPTSGTNATSVVRGVSLTSGCWIIIAGVQLGSLANTTEVIWGISTLLRTNEAVSTSFTTSAISAQTKSNGIQGTQQFETIGFYQNNTASAVPIYLNIALTYTSAPTIGTANYGYLKAFKIA
jgi:hypothetical protein